MIDSTESAPFPYPTHPASPTGFTFTPMPDRHRPGAALDALLKNPGQLIYELHQPARGRIVAVLAAVTLLCLALYGAAVGSFSGHEQWWAAPTKIVLGTALSALICLPSLYIFACLGGADLRLPALCGTLVAVLCLNALLLVGFAPVAWVFTQSSESVALIGGLHLVFWAVGAVFAFRLLSALLDFVNPRAAKSYLRLWFAVFLLVCLQMTTTLRPIVGRGDTFLTTKKLFFLSNWSKKPQRRDRVTLPPRMFDRREFLHLLARRVAPVALLGGLGGATYAAWEARRPRLTRLETTLRHLPAAFDGVTVAFLSDTHHGPFVSLEYLADVVQMTNALRPDIVALGGDYVQRRRAAFMHFGIDHRRFIAPGVGVFADLKAPLGRFAVLGNHDYRTDPLLTRRALAEAGFIDLTNTGVWLERPGGARLRIAGVDDCRLGRPRLVPALGDQREDEACLLLTHNPDYVELIRDPRVDLVLSGHTHGGQVVLPLVGAPVIPSRYGQKYRAGLVQAPAARVFVTTGVGTIGPPVRFRCPPEVALITLRSPFV